MTRLIPLSLALIGTLLACGFGSGQEPAKTLPSSEGAALEKARDEVRRSIQDLDADHFYQRQEAVAKLAKLAGQAELKELLAAEFARVLVAADTSFEVRKHIEQLQRSLPAAVAGPVQAISSDEIKQLVRQLEDDSYGMRLGAMRRLEWLLSDAKSVCVILVSLKERMAVERLSADTPLWLERMYERTRAAWLTSDPADWEMPPVSDAQIGGWIEDLVRIPEASESPPARRSAQVAKRELWDLLARDAYVPKLKAAAEARLGSGALGREAAARLQALLDLTRPAMVAEYWEGHHQLGSQHLVVGVPALTEGAIRPSHFDRIDDEMAHCVSGSNLAPGEYPVGVAFPHPNREGAAFQLVNLPTPRRRMAYQYLVKSDETKRLADLSRRTLDRYLRLKKPLARADLILLAQLDFAEVSRFAGRFFLAVDDEPLAPEEQPFLNQYLPGSGRVNSVMQRIGSRVSRHGLVAVIVAAEGTKEAIPGLLDAIEAGRFLPPATEPPRRFEWIAALAIAQRDPWPEVETWLRNLIARSVPLVERAAAHPPDLGATAAGILLKRRQQDLSQFGLEAVPDDLLSEVGVSGYRFTSDQARAKAVAWAKEK